MKELKGLKAIGKELIDSQDYQFRDLLQRDIQRPQTVS